ncbi:MAG: serine/threonine phosphatase [Microcystaceae cyanobacterium]
MLICPQCHSENPNRNNFCQKCGVSLTHQDCSQCGTSVLLSEPTCPNCGAVTGKVLYLLVRCLGKDAEAIAYPQLYENCVDIGQRYRLLEAEAGVWPAQGQVLSQGEMLSALVVDCQPLQPSVLKILLSQQTEFLTQLPDLQSWDENPVWGELRLPPFAFAYFKLRDLQPVVPDVYDAWCDGEHEYVLLSERQSWPSLMDILQQETLPSPQILFWMNEVVHFWQSLAPLKLAQSLLVSDNFRVDEDQNLVIQQLYPDSVDHLPLSELGQQWQNWFKDTPQVVPGSLDLVLQQLNEGKIEAIADLKAQLEDLSEEFHPVFLDEHEEGLQFINELEDSENHPNYSSIPSTLPDANIPKPSDADDMPTAVLPMQLIGLQDVGYTDRGRQRPHNEDYFGMTTYARTHRNNQGKGVQAKGIYVVCDGMGGHAAGEVASHMAVTTLQEFFTEHWQDELPSAETIAAGILLANDAIFGVNQKNSSSGSNRMGTTLVMTLIQNTKVAIAHVGDSRIYRITRKGGLEQLTVDHEVGQQAIQHGLDPKLAYSRPDAYQLTQALGPHDSQYVSPDVRLLDIEEDTLILLCSDGISDNDLLEENWENQLLPLLSSSQDVERGLRKFMEFANENNGHDNLTGVLIRMKVSPQIPMDVW